MSEENEEYIERIRYNALTIKSKYSFIKEYKNKTDVPSLLMAKVDLRKALVYLKDNIGYLESKINDDEDIAIIDNKGIKR